MLEMLDWNDLRYFLAVARDGSTLAAARELRVSQTTVARRIAALEDALGVHLFEKRQAGYLLTPIGQDLVARAEGVEAAATGFSDAAAAQSRDSSGVVKITTEEVYAITLLAPLLTERRPCGSMCSKMRGCKTRRAAAMCSASGPLTVWWARIVHHSS